MWSQKLRRIILAWFSGSYSYFCTQIFVSLYLYMNISSDKTLVSFSARQEVTSAYIVNVNCKKSGKSLRERRYFCHKDPFRELFSEICLYTTRKWSLSMVFDMNLHPLIIHITYTKTSNAFWRTSSHNLDPMIQTLRFYNMVGCR